MLNKIFYLTAEFPTHWQTYIVDEAEHLQSRGMQIFFATTRAPSKGAKSKNLRDRIGNKIEVLFPFSWRDLLWLFIKPSRLGKAFLYVQKTTEGGVKGKLRRLSLIPSAARMARLAKQKSVSHIHVHSFGNAAHIAAMIYDMSGITYTLTLHGSLSVWGGDIPAKTINASHIFSVTKPLSIELSNYYPKEKIKTVSMGIDFSKFNNVRIYEKTTEKFHIVTVARLHRSKGHVYTLEAIRRIKDFGLKVKYTIVGSGPHEAEILDHIERLELKDIVEMTGPQTSGEVAAILNESDALVLSSIGAGEAAPVSVMEAMASGLPVVCSRIGGTTDMIQDGDDGYLVSQGDVQAITEVLCRLASNPELRKAIGEKAREKAETAFSGHVVFETIYKTLYDIK